MSSITKLLSEKGRPMIGYEGYVYNFERKTDVKIIFRCQNRDCKGRCHTNLTMDTMIVQPTDHCHAPRIDIIPISVVKNKIKVQAVGTEESPSDILSSALQSFPLEFAVRLPQKDTLLRTIRRQRQHK